MTFKQRLACAVCFAVMVAPLPALAAPTESCVAVADIGKTWFIDGKSIMLKVRDEYKVLEFKDYLPASVQGKDFRFVRHDATETDDPTEVCTGYRVSGLATAENSAPIAKIVDVDIRQAANLVKRPERLAARRDNWKNWANLDSAQSNAYYLSSVQMNSPPPSPPQR